MIVHQFIAAAGPHDAVTEQALAWDEVIAGLGHQTYIVAERVDPVMKDRIALLRSFRRLPEPDAAVLHYSIWSGLVPFVRDSPWPLGICYHNITPGDLLRAHNPQIADLCDQGRDGLSSLRRARVAIAVSEFNARELTANGFEAPQVVPLLLPPPNSRSSERPDEPTSVLSVGRIAPNKRLEDCLRVFALYQRHHDSDARLTLVGSDDAFPTYGRALRALAQELGVRNVAFTGRISEAAKQLLYEQAHIYLCMSVHEGFCAPLVEAMEVDIPVVARAAGAVPETLGAGGIAINDKDPALFAEAIHLVRSDDELCDRIRRGAARQRAAFHPDAVSNRLRSALEPLLT